MQIISLTTERNGMANSIKNNHKDLPPNSFSRGAEGTGFDTDDDDALRRTLHWCSESAFFRELDLSPL